MQAFINRPRPARIFILTSAIMVQNDLTSNNC